MIDDKPSTTLKVLNWTIGMSLVWLALETFSPYFLGTSRAVSDFLHLMLVVILVVLGLAGKEARRRRSQLPLRMPAMSSAV